MNFNFRMMAVICSVAVTLTSGCRSSGTDPLYTSDVVPPLFSGGTQEADLVPVQVGTEDLTPAQSAGCSISFAEDHIGIRGEGAQVEGRTAVIKRGGVYSVSGECSNGRLIIESSEPVSLILTGLVLKSESGAAIESADPDAPLMLTVGTEENSLYGGILSGGDVTINGGGRLELIGDHALDCRDLKLCGAELEIYSRDDAIVSSGYVIAAAGTTRIKSAADGIVADGYVSIADGMIDIISGQNGIQAQKAVFISGGDVTLSSGGGSSAVKHMRSGAKYPYGRHGGFSTDGSADFDFSDLVSGDGSSVASKKGIRSGGRIEISGGTLGISSADDSLFARTDAVINGGIVKLSSGDDAIHAERSVVIDGGETYVSASYNAVEGFNISVLNGMVDLCSYYDGITAAGGSDITGAETSADVSERYISISGGVVTVSSGGDGIDSAGTVAVSGGELTVFSSEKGGSLVYGDSCALSGGLLAAFGSSEDTMAPTLVSGPCLSVYADISAGSRVLLKDSSGAVLFDIVLSAACGSVIMSSAEMVSGETYTLLADGETLAVITAADGISGEGPDGSENGGIYEDLDGTHNSNDAVAA